MKKELSEKNPVYITKERFYELKHFVKQYNWFKERAFYIAQDYPDHDLANARINSGPGDPTYTAAVKLAAYKSYIDQIDRSKLSLLMVMKMCPQVEHPTQVMEIVTNGAIHDASYDVMQASMKDVMPISRKQYYFWLRVFFFKLDQIRLEEA